MAEFTYKEITKQGTVVEGKQEAATKDEVIAAIRSRGSSPIQVNAIEEGSKNINISFGQGKPKSKVLSIFSKQLYVLLNAGMPLLNSIEALEKQTENKMLKDALADINVQLQKGAIFSAALDKHPNVFPQLFRSMVKSGEMSGNLDGVLDNLSTHYQKDAALSSQIKGAMMYPIVISIFAIGVVVLLVVKLIPMFKSLFEGKELPAITQFMLDLSNLLITKWWLIILVVIGIGVAFSAYKASPQGRLSLDKLKINMPGLGKYIKIIITSRFASTLAVLISSGIPILQAIGSAAAVTNNKVVELKMQDAVENIKKGIPMSTEFEKLNVFPPMMISMIKVGEESGAIDSMLLKTSEFYEEELEASVKKMTSLMEPVMIIFFGVVVAVVLLSIYLPMFEMSTSGVG